MTVRTVPRRAVLVRVLIGLAAVALLVLLFGVGDRQVGIFELGGEPGTDDLTMAVESCNQNPRVEVEETASQVRLSAFIDRPGLLEGHDDCLDQVGVTLKSNLGDRVIIDTSSGKELAPKTD